MKLIKFLFSRLFLVGCILVFQMAWICFMIVYLGIYSGIVNTILTILSICVVLWLVSKTDNPAYKLAWVIPILIFPVLGGLLYLSIGNKKPTRGLRNRLDKIYKETAPLTIQDPAIMKELEELDKGIANQAQYISKHAFYPIHKNTVCEYYKSGEEKFIAMKQQLRKAKHFIFLEYFIIESGIMWDSILEILIEKVKEGVEVRLIYDDVGCLCVLPYHYYKKIQKTGINCVTFNPFIPIFSVAMNNRDHRKILVIDGYIGFTGGINLADEYINIKERFGHWKDTGILVRGEGAWNLTVMFLQMWNIIKKTDTDFTIYKPHLYYTEAFESDGYVQPYGDSPLDSEIVGENVYLNLIHSAKKYIYIFTPYLIIDNEMITSICLAAKKGVDVRIVTPGIPDKKYVFLLTQSYYAQLVDAGVKIYEYTPGFIHAKCVVCDDEIATIGTINFDYRSLYLHFECGVFLYRSKAVLQVKEDALATFSVSKQITEEMCKKNLPKRFMQAILRLLAPLL